jgi:hypothetical protein
MYKEADMSYQYQFPAQFSKNEHCYLLGTTPNFSCLFIVPFQLTYVELLPFGDGKESANG